MPVIFLFVWKEIIESTLFIVEKAEYALSCIPALGVTVEVLVELRNTSIYQIPFTVYGQVLC